MNRDEHLISVEELLAELSSARTPIVLDVRWRLDQPDGREEFNAGHVPGSHYVSLDDVFTAHSAPTDGRHPLPASRDLALALSTFGVDAIDTPIVTLDNMSSWAASRAWWVLRDAGFASVRVLDGGWAAWRASGAPVELGSSLAVSAPVLPLAAGHLRRLTMDEAAALPAAGTLIDARAPERFRGEVEPIDPRAGHIPGARNVPVGSVFEPDGRFKSVDALERLFSEFESAGQSIGVYCGSGVSASPLILAMALTGRDAALYPGSWSQWSNHPDRPVAIGSE